MTPRIVQDAEPGAELATRCQTLNLPLLHVSVDGKITAAHFARSDRFDRAVVNSPLFTRELRACAAEWTDGEPEPTRLWPGCWLVPLPIVQRRQRVAYHVVLAIDAQITQAPPFPAWCDAAQLDAQALASRLQREASVGDIQRIAALLRWMAADMATVHRQEDDISRLSQQLGESYEELSLVYQLSARMTVTQDVATFLSGAVAELQQVVGFRWVAMYLTDRDARLQGLRGRTLVAGDAGRDESELAQLGANLLQRFGSNGSTLIANAAELGLEQLAASDDRVMIVPIVREGKAVAVLFGAEQAGCDELSSVDGKLVTSAAQSMGIFLENAMLYEDMQDMFMGTLRSLIATIDAKDTYTCGHSERVALLSRELAAAAGLDAAEVERVYLSALVHDVGKIGVPEAVLCKAGRLTHQEFAMIKAHPEIGVRILQDIHQMSDLLPGVLHHHERWDGGGYPHRLAGDQIPLFGRIICLADSFDAMSSDRTYRYALNLEDALTEIRTCAGSHFDPELARVFVKLDFTPYHELIVEHQRRESPLSQAMKRAM